MLESTSFQRTPNVGDTLPNTRLVLRFFFYLSRDDVDSTKVKRIKAMGKGREAFQWATLPTTPKVQFSWTLRQRVTNSQDYRRSLACAWNSHPVRGVVSRDTQYRPELWTLDKKDVGADVVVFASASSNTHTRRQSESSNSSAMFFTLVDQTTSRLHLLFVFSHLLVTL